MSPLAKRARLVLASGRRKLRRGFRALEGTPRVRSESTAPFAGFLPLDGPELVPGPRPRLEPASASDPRLVVLMPHLDLGRMSGGPNTIFQVTARLLPAGVRIRYVATKGRLHPDGASVLDHIHEVTGVAVDEERVDLLDASTPGACLPVGANDVLLATWWPTAHVAHAAWDLVAAREFIYLIQDYEPGFYPWSTRHALAAATYDMPIRAIINEPMLLDYLRAQGAGQFAARDLHRRAISFQPSVDRVLFAPRNRTPGSPRRLVFYARPRNPRNLFDLGLRALRAAVAAGVFDSEPWEFVAVGQELVDLPLSESHWLRAQPWKAYAEYARFLGESDLLLSLMLSPHTSYPPLEMAATGGWVVTNTFGAKTVQALAAISPHIRAAPPNLDALVAAIRATVPEVTQGDRPRPIVNIPATWDEAMRDVVPWLHEAFLELSAAEQSR